MSEKRALPSKVAKMKARKKQKLDPAATKEKKAAPASKKKVRDVDQLGWKKASFPEGMGDFEGLYGDFFEEISDTEIVKEPSGEVVFQVAAAKVEAKSNKRKAADEDDDDEDDAEWGGIDDDDASPDKPETITAADEAVPEKVKEANGVKEVKDVKKVKEVKKGTKETKAAKAAARAEILNARGAERKAAKEKGKTVGTGESGLPETPYSVLEALTEDQDEDVDIAAWTKLGLSDDVLAALSKMKFARPTKIQAAAIPDILAGSDMIGKAPTGSGKTLAFGIPIYDYWLAQQPKGATKDDKDETKQPTALIVLPTRELAVQIADHLTKLCSQSHLKSPVIATLTGGMSIQKQRRLLAHADIVIATPGRLWEVMTEGEGTLTSLKAIKFLVIDEADRLLSEGHFKELEDVLTALDRKITHDDGDEAESTSSPPTTSRQTLVFSATFSKDLHKKLSKRAYSSRSTTLSNQASMEYLLQKLSFREERPRFIDVNPISQMASTLREGLVECASGMDKDLYLYTLLLYHPNTRALVFVNSISAVRRIVPFLTNLNLTAYPLHSQMPQKARLRSIERFSSTTPPKPNPNLPAHMQSTTQILVATDVAARGLDIPDVHLILHYHLPRTSDTYVHRSGRTARAENAGSSILLCAPQEAAGVRRLVAQVHAKDAAGAGDKKTVGKKEAHYYMRTLDVDSRVVSALKPRVVLAKKIADASMAKEKQGRSDEWFKTAAEELGVDMDEEDFDALTESQGGGKKGKGSGRREKEKVAQGMSKGEMGAMKAELRGLLGKRVNVGVSERYLTSGAVDVEGLLKGQATGEFLGRVPSLGFDD